MVLEHGHIHSQHPHEQISLVQDWMLSWFSKTLCLWKTNFCGVLCYHGYYLLNNVYLSSQLLSFLITWLVWKQDHLYTVCHVFFCQIYLGMFGLFVFWWEVVVDFCGILNIYTCQHANKSIKFVCGGRQYKITIGKGSLKIKKRWVAK